MKKKERPDPSQGALLISKIESVGLLRLVPQDVVVHALEMLDGRDMAVNVGDVRQTVMTTGNTAVGVVDVEERRVIPHFLVVGVNGIAGFGRILELV